MSNLAPVIVACPRCQTEQRATVFESLNSDHMPDKAELVAAGTFERMRCEQCGHAYRPEHPMLYAHFSARTWIVMHPRLDRNGFATIEHGVELVMKQQAAEAPASVAAGLVNVRPRLVFGQHMLTEAVRCQRAGLEPAVLECAKLLALRDSMHTLMARGPVELCFDRMTGTGDLVHTICSLATGEPQDTFELGSAFYQQATAARAELEQVYPDLFHKPYISACRYLYGAMI